MNGFKTILAFQRLSVGYGSKATLQNLNLEAAEGQFICLTGRNGSGKSTLIRTMAGLQKPLEGQIFCAGSDIRRQSAEALAKYIGLVLTKRPLVDFMQVQEMVSMGRYPHVSGMANLAEHDRHIVVYALEQAGIAHLAGNYINEISDGECQKAMIARVLAQQTPVIILDEPTAFLDHESKIHLFVLLRHLAEKQGKTIICATHDLELAGAYAHKFWHTAAGTVNVSDKINVPG